MLPKSPDWDSDGESRSESEGLSSYDFREHTVESLVLRVIGQSWSGEKVFVFLEDWELARVALSCHTAPDMLYQEMYEASQLGCCCQIRPAVTASGSLFSHRGRAVS